MSRSPVIAVSMGDPYGIGPEVCVKALHFRGSATRGAYVVLGDAAAMTAAARIAGIAPFWDAAATWPEPASLAPGRVVLVSTGEATFDGPPRPTCEGGAASFRWVDEGISACLDRRAAGLVTAPINKEAWALAGHADFPGHTELLADRCADRAGSGGRVRMMFEAPNLRTILVTTHQSLASVSGSITAGRVFDTIALGHESCVRLGIAAPRVAVCGLNPHASEGGLFGDEEARAIVPAIAQARARGIDAAGPYPGDTVFGAAARGRFDLVVAMYHDQGLIPVKLLAFDRAVNVTVGLTIIHTSPDHGTAYDIAGQGKADPGSMVAALELAERLALHAPR